MSLKTATGDLMAMVRRSFAQKRGFGKAHFSGLNELRLEEFVSTTQFRSSCVTNGKDGPVSPVQENIHHNILSKLSGATHAFQSHSTEKAKGHGSAVRRTTELSRVLCVEMFATDDIIVNEIAPRPHNSTLLNQRSLRLYDTPYSRSSRSTTSTCYSPPMRHCCHAQYYSDQHVEK